MPVPVFALHADEAFPQVPLVRPVLADVVPQSMQAHEAVTEGSESRSMISFDWHPSLFDIVGRRCLLSAAALAPCCTLDGGGHAFQRRARHVTL